MELSNLLNYPFDALGKYSKTPLFPTKTFLSVNKKGEWNVRTLNVVQLLLRKFFGWYRDTHLRTLAIAWNTYQDIHGNVCPALSKRISGLWAKKYSTSILKEPAEVFIFGNSTPSDAMVLGICQLHSDPNEAKFTAQIIAENYREGDVILVEGIDADKIVRSDEIQQTLCFPKKAEIHGWEPVGFQVLSDFVFEPILFVIEKFELNASMFLKLMNNVNFEKSSLNLPFMGKQKTHYWKDCLQSAVEGFIKGVGKIDARFQMSSLDIDAKEMEDHSLTIKLNLFLDVYKAFALSKKNDTDGKNLLSSFFDVYELCRIGIEQNKYKAGWTQAQNEFFINTWSKRQESLVNEIHKNRELQKRVIVCAGSALFFQKRGREPSDSLNAMQNHKYSLVIQNNESQANYYSFAELASRYGSFKT